MIYSLLITNIPYVIRTEADTQVWKNAVGISENKPQSGAYLLPLAEAFLLYLCAVKRIYISNLNTGLMGVPGLGL